LGLSTRRLGWGLLYDSDTTLEPRRTCAHRHDVLATTATFFWNVQNSDGKKTEMFNLSMSSGTSISIETISLLEQQSGNIRRALLIHRRSIDRHSQKDAYHLEFCQLAVKPYVASTITLGVHFGS
jgi:hypothetical protein